MDKCDLSPSTVDGKGLQIYIPARAINKRENYIKRNQYNQQCKALTPNGERNMQTGLRRPSLYDENMLFVMKSND